MTVLAGRVTAFDARRGVGRITVEGDAPGGAAHRYVGSDYHLHCTAIADGTRRIEVGAEVHFAPVPGRQGHWEAADVTPRR
jgi:cold shock CspA family protein